MKKIISILLCLAVCLGLAACDNGGGDTSSTGSTAAPHSVDVIARMTEGKIPEAAVALGTGISDTKDTLNSLEELPEDADPDEGYTYYYEFEDGDVVKLDCEGIFYCYNKSKRSEGISAIVAFDTAYAFDGTYMMGDVTAAINAKGTSYSPTEDDLFFVLGAPETEKYTAVYYTVGDYRLDFFFYDSFLTATVLQNTTLWDPTATED